MDHRYLATQDGSEQAEGRGSGLEEAPEPQYDDYKDADEQPTAQGSSRGRKRIKPTPYMSMTYAPTERRLDTAIFRAMFASSTRQARQFVVHGGVKVNGQKVRGFAISTCTLLIVSDDLSRISAQPWRYVPGRRRASTVCHRSAKDYRYRAGQRWEID